LKKGIAYIDGACSGNPGNAGIGVLLCDENGIEVCEISRYIGPATNNIAEYQALVACLDKAKELSFVNLTVYTDSELLARQINGLYKVKDEKLKILFMKAKTLMQNFADIKIHHIVREKNKKADKLATESIANLE
jgi:ribonuclease HI